MLKSRSEREARWGGLTAPGTVVFAQQIATAPPPRHIKQAHIEQGSKLVGKICGLRDVVLVARPDNKTGAWIHYEDLDGQSKIECVELDFGDAIPQSK